MAAPPMNWRASFQQGFQGASQRFQDGAMQFGQVLQQGYNGAQTGFQTATTRASMAVRGYSERFQGYNGGGQGTMGFNQMSAPNPQFNTMMTSPMMGSQNTGMRNNQGGGGFDYPQNTPTKTLESPRNENGGSRCSGRSIIGILLIILILAGGGAGVGILLNLNNQKLQAANELGANQGVNATNTSSVDNNPFQIDLLFVGSITDEQKAAFLSAKARWESVITADLPSQAEIKANSNFCGFTIKQDIVIDDLLIFVQITPIDGAGKILGSAGPCGFDQNNMPRLGSMQFDTADVAQLIAANQFTDVVLHEMGHVLGIGSQWDTLNLLTPANSKNPTGPVAYLGSNGNLGNQEIGASGNAVVENLGGAGTARGHWKDSVYQNELMTGFLSNGKNPMSRLTVRSLVDLGYTVDPTKADDFEFSSGRRLRDASQPRLEYGNDIANHEKVQLKTRRKRSNDTFELHPRKNHL